MQGQKGYVNGYVVIIFAHYINRCEYGRMRENVTRASFFEGLVRVEMCIFGTWVSLPIMLMWRAGLPALGRAAAPKSDAGLCLVFRVLPYWGCFAAQRGQARSPQKPARHN
ncbi:hypothetical protein CXQ82_10335 [Pseudomonas sp. S09G 359]|nr:hypothetical protein CXQ82_10335 [Pseudomonas sp. S09G 359]